MEWTSRFCSTNVHQECDRVNMYISLNIILGCTVWPQLFVSALQALEVIGTELPSPARQPPSLTHPTRLLPIRTNSENTDSSFEVNISPSQIALHKQICKIQYHMVRSQTDYFKVSATFISFPLRYMIGNSWPAVLRQCRGRHYWL